jgi:hypothetical protein
MNLWEGGRISVENLEQCSMGKGEIIQREQPE